MCEMFPFNEGILPKKGGGTAQIKGRPVVLINVFFSLIPLFTSAERHGVGWGEGGAQ